MFAEQLKEARQRLGLSQAEAARLLDIGKRSLEHWETGDRVPITVAQEGALARLSSAGRAAGAGGVRDARRAKKRRGS
jgi:transcriptional regulator with XRE-family HTH domain